VLWESIGLAVTRMQVQVIRAVPRCKAVEE